MPLLWCCCQIHSDITECLQPVKVSDTHQEQIQMHNAHKSGSRKLPLTKAGRFSTQEDKQAKGARQRQSLRKPIKVQKHKKAESRSVMLERL